MLGRSEDVREEIHAIRSRRGQHHPLVRTITVSYTHLRAHETVLDLVCRLLLEKKKTEMHECEGTRSHIELRYINKYRAENSRM